MRAQTASQDLDLMALMAEMEFVEVGSQQEKSAEKTGLKSDDYLVTAQKHTYARLDFTQVQRGWYSRVIVAFDNPKISRDLRLYEIQGNEFAVATRQHQKIDLRQRIPNFRGNIAIQKLMQRDFNYEKP